MAKIPAPLSLGMNSLFLAWDGIKNRSASDSHSHGNKSWILVKDQRLIIEMYREIGADILNNDMRVSASFHENREEMMRKWEGIKRNNE